MSEKNKPRPLNEGSRRNSQTKTGEYKPKTQVSPPERPTSRHK